MLSDRSSDMQSINSIQKMLKQLGTGENGGGAYSIGTVSPLVKCIANILGRVNECCGLQYGEGVGHELKEEVRNLLGELERMKDKADSFSETSDELEKQIAKLRQDLKNNNYIEEMAIEAEGKLLLRLQDVEKELKYSKATIGNLQREVLWSSQENKRLEQLSEESRLQMQKMSLLIKELNDKLDDAKSEILSLDEANRNLNEYKDKNEASKNRLQLRNEELEGLVESLHEELLNSVPDNDKFLGEIEGLRIHINREESKNRDLIMELRILQEKFDDLNLKSQVLRNERVLSDELSDANTKVDNFTQTEIDHGCSGQEEVQKESRLLDEGYCDSLQKEKEPELNSEQDYSETNRPYHDQYELIKTEHLSQIFCNDPLEILEKQGHSESEIGEICSRGDSWYTQMNVPVLENTVPPPLMDSRGSLRKQVCRWFCEDHHLTESEEKLNRNLLNIVKYLDWHDEGALFGYDNGSVHELKEFLEDNKSNPDLEVVIKLRRGESGATVLHAVSGAHIYQVGSNKKNRAVSLLLAAGADPNAKTREGETPLHYAAAIGNSEGVSSLLRGGADSNICNRQGKTPQRVAVDDGNYNVAGLLLTKEQEELRRELYDTLVMPVYGPIRFTKTLKEFLDKHKSNQDLKVVLNIRSERGELEVLECARNITYIDKAIGAEIRNLFLGAGASCDVSHCMAGEKCPPVLWYHLMPDQQKKLDSFLGRVSKAEDMDELKKVIDEAIRSGVRLNFNKDLSPGDRIACNWYSLTDYTIKRIGELNKLKRNSKVASDIVCNLVSAGAVSYNRNSVDVIEELELEFKSHRNDIVDSYTCHVNNAHKLVTVARSATDGRLNDVRMDNAVFYLEYSEESTINVAMITDGVGDQLSQKQVGYTRHMIRIGKSEVEIITEDGIRNYTNLADNSDIVLIFYTSQGELEVRLFPDTKNKDLIMVKVNNQDLLKQLKNCKEKIGENALLGGLSVNQAIEQGFFTRLGEHCQYSETINSTAQTMTEKKQLLQDLRNVQSNIVKEEKNFDAKTHLIDVFKALFRLCEEKEDISKTDLVKAAEERSKKSGLEGKYNWSKIFGLEEEIIEKAEKQGDKEQKSNIPDDFYLGHAINNGSCFFDSFRQSLEQQKGIKVTVEQLRNECKRFAQDNPPEWFISKIGNDFDEVEGEFVNRGTTCDQYINSIEKNQFWGRTDIEGRILCRKYDVKLHVIESNPLNATGEQQDPYLHQQIDSSGSISAGEYNRIDYDDNDVLHIVNKGHDHFEPLLNSNKILAKCYSSSPRCNMDELKIESHQHKSLLVSG